MSPAPDRHIVTAVLVAHQGARWLPETLKALLTQTRPVERFVAVDTGSEDRGPAVLTEVVGEGNLLRLPAGTTYGAAVAQALRHPAATLAIPDEDGGAERTEWIWLLHDDSAPAHDALALLLRVAEGDPNIALLGPKLRDWDDRRRLLELGVTLDGAGRRDTGVDFLELDQGQHDGIRDVLGVSTAGMLVRRDAWTELGGLDTGFGLFRDDVDLGWRAHAAGHRVVAVSDAVVHHAEASARGLREIGIPGGPAPRMDRRNALYVLLGNLPLGPALRALARNVLATALRTLHLLITKRRAAARAELAALADVLRHPLRLRRTRAARAEQRRHVYHSVRRYQPRRVALRRLVEAVAARFSPAEPARDEPAIDPAPEGPGLVRRLLGHPGLVLGLGLTAVTLAAERSLLTAGSRLGGGALVPAWGGASDLWRQYVDGWHPVGLGSAEGAPPSTAIVAALSTLAFGKPWLAVSLVLLGSVPLAGLTAYAVARKVIPELPRTGRRAAHRRIPTSAVRVWAAATYALLPVATGAIAAGRLGTAVVHVLLPVIVLLVARMYGLPRSRRGRRTGRRIQSRRAAWGVALLLAVCMAFVPLTWPLAVVGGVLIGAAFGPAGTARTRRSRRVDSDLVVALAVPPLLLLPWSFGLLLHPSRFLLEAGLHVSDGAASAASLLALNPGGPGTPPAWVLYGLLLVAVLALPLRSRRVAVLAGWMLGLLGLMAAVLASATVVTKGAERAVAWPGVALLFAAAGLLVAATAAVLRAAESLAAKHLIYRSGGALVAVAALTAPVLAGLSWVASGAGDPLREVPPDIVPGFVRAGDSPRTLVLSKRGPAVSYTVLRGAEPRFGESETATGGPARRRMDGLVAALAAGRADGPALGRMGIRYVLVPRPAANPITPVLDASPELVRLSRTPSFGAWRLLAPAGRLMLLEGTKVTPLAAGETSVTVRIPPGTGTRTLLLAEPADDGWRATLNGAEPKGSRVDGWAQAYQIPSAGGEFKLDRSMWLRHTWVVLQGIAVLVVAILALPGAPETASVDAGGRARLRRRAARLRRGDRTGTVQWEQAEAEPEAEQQVTAGGTPT